MLKKSAWISLFLPLAACAGSDGDPDRASDDPSAVVVANVDNGTYVIKSSVTGKCIDIPSGAPGDGIKVQQWTCNGADAQKFKIENVGGNKFTIENVASHKVLEVKDASTEDNALIQQRGYVSGANQQWFFVNQGGNDISIQAAHSQKAIDLPWGKADDGLQLLQYAYWGGANQKWIFEKISGVGAKPTFRNPINIGPDPYMAFYNGNYYLATTQGDAVRMWKAPTVGALLSAPPTTVWKDSDPSRNREVWAPSFYMINGRWYLYFTGDDGIDDHHRIYVVESDGADPLGPYHFKAKLAPPGSEEVWAIDQELLQQDKGLYLLWSGAGVEGHNMLYVAPMSNPWTVSGSRTYIPASGGCPEVREGPSILKHNGTNFLIYSTCDTGKPDYQLWMKSIPTGADPMKAQNWVQYPSPVLVRNNAGGVYGPGHNGFFKSPDGTEDWLVYHAKNTTGFTYEGRTTRISKVNWNADGTPNFGVPPAVGATMDVPSGDPGGGSYWINDTGSSSSVGSVVYSNGWNAYSTCGVQCFWGDDHGSAQAGATATFTFKGTQIALLSVHDVGNGIAAFSIDDGPETTTDLYMGIRQGEQLTYMSPHLAFGDHKLRVRVTGNKRAESTGVAVSIDRAEVFTN